MPSMLVFIGMFGVTLGLFVWLVIYLFVLHQERGEKLVYWLSSFIAWSGKKAEKTATAMSIQSKVDSFINSINSEVESLFPYNLKIKWVASDLERSAFIEKDRVIVMLDYHKNKDENLSKATILYMNKAVIPEARPHIHNKLSKAIDLMMTKKALYSFIEARSCLNHFVETILRPSTENDDELKSFCETVEIVDERGLFTRIMLRELLELGLKRSGVTENGETVYETTEFIKMLKTIAEKEKGVDVKTDFLSKNIRVAVVFVARPEMIEFGTAPYTNRINELIKKSANTFYIFARSDRNVDFAKTVVASSVSKFPSLVNTHEEEYAARTSDGKILKNYCAILYNRKSV